MSADMPVALQKKTEYLLVRFLAVGFLNSVFGYGCFAILLYAGIHYALALLMATVAGVLFNFKSTGVLVFKSHNNRLIFRFVMVYTLLYGINVAGIKLLQITSVEPYYGGAFMIIPMALLAFLLNRKYVFHSA
jgi:putative flippase GtrA